MMMVNWATFVRNECTEPTNLQFTNRAFSRLFIIFLGDFLSEIKAGKNGIVPLGLSRRTRDDAPPSDKTFLFHIRQVCTNPKLGKDSTCLRQTADAFAAWLEGEFDGPKCQPLCDRPRDRFADKPDSIHPNVRRHRQAQPGTAGRGGSKISANCSRWRDLR